jgi:hypothetical protein
MRAIKIQDNKKVYNFLYLEANVKIGICLFKRTVLLKSALPSVKLTLLQRAKITCHILMICGALV